MVEAHHDGHYAYEMHLRDILYALNQPTGVIYERFENRLMTSDRLTLRLVSPLYVMPTGIDEHKCKLMRAPPIEWDSTYTQRNRRGDGGCNRGGRIEMRRHH